MTALRGQTACVTGGSRGIGRAIAAALTAAGAHVTILGRSQNSLKAAVAEGVAAASMAVDVADLSTLAQAVARIAPSILVNNAGGATTGSFLKSDVAALRHMFALNVESAAEATRAALPAMLRARTGRIINVASTAGLKGYAYVSAYGAAKHALVGLTRALAIEFAASGVTVNALCPGYTDTDLVRAGIAAVVANTQRTEAEARAHFTTSNPMGRLMTPEEVAAAALWLAGPAAGGITGQCIAIAGGEI